MSTKTKEAPEATADGDEKPKKSKKKLIIIALVLVLVGGAGYWFFLKPSSAEAAPVPGEVVPLEAIQINLEEGHYLRLGLALQLVEGAHEVDGSKALDATIELFSGKSMEEVQTAKERKHLKEELEEELDHAYHGEVLEVYFTDFVTQ
ncbi:flagellar basal body-associated protein FliL [Nocardioides sp. SR21]|uniref:flagellar basal body-associated FliL family protein n=1 Tax=Nocardioides sp. SR21 TaxID=2919501 RepID=UPI001FAAEEBE|nr:flagellar basal body-associated FliL family protein [Nocardioides sp. SR21]